MAEKVILEGRSAEDLIDLFRRENALTPEIKEYFTSYCDCDITEWLIAQLTAHNQEVVDRVNELLAAYDPYPVRRETKFPVHGHLVKTFCDGKDLKGYYAINSQGLQSYDKKIIVANSPLCGQFIIKDSFKAPNANYTTDIAEHDSEVGILSYRDPQYSDSLPFRQCEIFSVEVDGLHVFNQCFLYNGNAIESPFETQGFSYVESIPWTKPNVEMSTTVFFPLIQGSTELANWPVELGLGFGWGGDPASPVMNTRTGDRMFMLFHRYDPVGAAASADPNAYYESRFDPRDNQIYTETWFPGNAGLFIPARLKGYISVHYMNDDNSINDSIVNIMQAAIKAGTAEGHYRVVADGNGNIPIFFTKEKRTQGGELLGYELTFSIQINSVTKKVTSFINGIKIEEFPFTIDFREMKSAWYPQVYYTGFDNNHKSDLLGFVVTDFYVKEVT